jgi:predicted O-methyltransferase YrrM
MIKIKATRTEQFIELLSMDPDLHNVLWSLRRIPGSITFGQQALLYILAKECKGKARICNIGAKYGLSTACLAKGAPQAEIVTLEPSPKYARAARKNLAKFPNVRVDLRKSWDYPVEKWDLVFVDGCHKQIKRDLVWYRRLTLGGLFLSHDYNPHKRPWLVAALDGLLMEIRKTEYDVSLLDERDRGIVGVYRG